MAEMTRRVPLVLVVACFGLGPALAVAADSGWDHVRSLWLPATGEQPDVAAAIRKLEAPLTGLERVGLFDPTATPARLVACEQLRGAGPGSTTTAAALVRMLSVWPVAPAAANVLDARCDDAVPELVAATADPDPRAQGTAVQIQCRLGERSVRTAE